MEDSLQILLKDFTINYNIGIHNVNTDTLHNLIILTAASNCSVKVGDLRGFMKTVIKLCSSSTGHEEGHKFETSYYRI